MALATDLRPTLTAARGIAGGLGLRPHTVSIVATTRTGDYGLEGTVSTVTTPVTEASGQPPKVRRPNGRELALGNISNGALIVGPITPSFAGGGTSLATMLGLGLADEVTLHYEVTGPGYPSGQAYRLTDHTEDSALHYTVTLEPIAVAP